MQLSEEQLAAKKAIESGENVFVTAAGGYGKSALLNSVDQSKSVLSAPTGIAALNVNGTTLHKVFGLPIGIPTDADKYKVPPKMRQLFQYNTIKKVFIDEIGMCRPDYLDIIDARLKTIKGNKKPFGGIQMVVFGDFHQIQPIVKPEEHKFWSTYDSCFAFSAKSWEFNTIELTKPFRTTNMNQLDILSHIRTRKEGWNNKFKELMDISTEYPKDSDILHLCAYKADAEGVNNHHFNKIEGKTQTFFSKSYGTEKFNDSEKPVPDTLQLKVGCKVLVKANDISGMYVNGDRGVVTSLGKDYVDVEVRGSIVRIEAFNWDKYGYTASGEKIVVARYKQIPLLLGYAITTHSVQGMTLDEAILDVGRGCFAHGQFYMAISRLRDLAKLGFTDKSKVTMDNVIVREEVIDYYRSLKKQ